MSFFDKIEVGLVLDIGSYTFDAEGIKKFAAKFDPQPFHLDEEAAKDSIFGALCASGWHTISVWMRMNITNGRKLLEEKTDFSGPMPEFGMSPGAKNIKWLRPVFVGDTINYTTTVAGKRLLASKPGWGYLQKHNEGYNQHGDKVMEFDGGLFMRVD